MNTKRNNEITVVIAAITVTAALVSGLLTVRSANAAPGSKTTASKKAAAKKANAKRVVSVKMSGSRRAAINRALALQNAATVAQNTSTQPITTTDPGNVRVEVYGEPTQLPGTVTSGTGLQPLNSTPINNPLGTPLQPDPRSNNPIGATNVPGVVNNFGNPFALYGPPLINTGNGFAPVYGTGYNLNGYTAAPFNGGGSPYGNFSNNSNYLYGATNFGY
ncbi:MAG: hypothetical protein H7Y38_20345 [Armatimonadetes bacterium]|nr:hypothetical protein [Armatimonadota bacterium]